MKNRIKRILFPGVAACVLLAACGLEHSGRLTVATAANMQFVMEELVREFTEETGIACETVTSSSGKLTAQIREGAPFDVFVSADMKYPAELFKGGFARAAPEIYAYGKLVMWSMTAGTKPSVDSLIAGSTRHIALANPRTAPYGRAAVEVLKHYHLLEKVKSKLVYGESISQTNQFVLSEAAEVGFTSLSVVLSPEMKDRGTWKEVNTGTYSPIAQGVVVLNTRKTYLEQAQKFHDFLFSEKGKSVLNKFGYSVSLFDK